MNKILGIDIGSQGALALLDEAGALLDVADMPILRDGPRNRPNVNAPLLANHFSLAGDTGFRRICRGKARRRPYRRV
jgi:hypothetical protein